MNRKYNKLFFNSSLCSNLVKLSSPKDVHVHNINLFREYMNLYKDKKLSSSLPGKYSKLSNLILPKIINYNSTRNIKCKYSENFFRNSVEQSFEIQNNNNRLSNIDGLSSFRALNSERVLCNNKLKERHRNFGMSNRFNQYSSTRGQSTKKRLRLKKLLICSPVSKFPINNSKKRSSNNLFKNDLIKTILNNDTCFNAAWK